MSDNNTSRAIRYLPQVAVATAAVVAMPVVVVWWLHSAGIVTSPWLCIALAILLSVTASTLGSAYWKRCSGSCDLFFSELLLWGWLHRFRSERRLAKTVGLLGLDGFDSQLSLDDETLEEKARVLRQMAAAVDAQDPYTDGHSRRVALHSATVARKMGLDREEVAKLRIAAAIHDIGKLRIPQELLNKPERLSEAEFELVKAHADEGAEIVGCMGDPGITEMVRHHHERFDGNGYPSGLVAEQIPLGARIIAVADTFDALTSVRPYRKAISHKRALETIAEVSGTQLDPAVVRAFLRCYSANRAAFFWSLVAVSPTRAVTLLRGKSPGGGMLASSTAAVSLPAALAAVAVTAFGPVGGAAASHSPLRLAQQPSVQSGGIATDPHHQSSHAKSSHRRSRGALTPSQKVAVLGVHRARGALTKHSLRGGSTTATSGAGSSPAASGNGSGAGQGGSDAGSGGGSGGGKRGGAGGRHGTTPASPPAGGTGTDPSPASGMPADPAAPTISVDPTTTETTGADGSDGSSVSDATTTSTEGSTAAPGDAGSTGSDGGGNSGGGGSGGGGSGGSGSGGSGGSVSGSGSGAPLTMDDCKNGGWASYGFPNQGQCVASVEHQLHP